MEKDGNLRKVEMHPWNDSKIPHINKTMTRPTKGAVLTKRRALWAVVDHPLYSSVAVW